MDNKRKVKNLKGLKLMSGEGSKDSESDIEKDSKPIRLKIDPVEFPNIRKLLRTKNLQDLYEKFGLEIDRDLNWPSSDIKGESGRAAAILEMLGRRTKDGT